MPMYEFLSLLPSVLALVGFVIYVLRPKSADDRVVRDVVSKLRKQSPFDPTDYATMTPARLKATLEADKALRDAVGQQDFELLKTTLRHQFIGRLVVYTILVIVFCVGLVLFFFQHRADTSQAGEAESLRLLALEQIYGGKSRMKADAVRRLVASERKRVSQNPQANSIAADYIDLHDVDLTGAWLENADLQKISFRKAILRDTNFNGAQLDESSFRFALLVQAHFLSAKARHVQFAFADLAQVQLCRADLSNALFAHCRIRGADLSGADLTAVSFIGCDLRGAILTDIKNWTTVESMQGSNVSGVQGAPSGFVDWAISKGATSDAGAADLFESAREAQIRTEESP
jgi:uncharacterized protein YjbI with pentapeptide repeats